MAITDPLVLPADIILVPVEQLPPQMRQQLEYDEGDYAITRPRSRTPSSIVDSLTAELLEKFRSPKTIVEAVISYSQGRNADPEETLVEAYPMLQRFVSSKLLVPGDSEDAHRIVPSFEPEERVAQFEVVKCIQVLEDTELYQVQSDSGELAALKITRPGYTDNVKHMFAREAALLSHLGGSVGPALLDAGTFDGREYLAIAWCPGVPLSVAFEEARHYPGVESRKRLLHLCVITLDAYARLHAQGVTHSDVHPRNVLVDADGAVKIIDYGLARLQSGDEHLGRINRGGIGFFFEPEFALAGSNHHFPPDATMQGEQYSLAAMLYLLLAGTHYLNFSLEKTEMMRQIAEDKPLPFSRHGVKPWPEVEQLLGRALSKDPSERFPSVREFANAATAITVADDDAPLAGSDGAMSHGPGEDLLAEVLQRLSPGGALYKAGLPSPPTCSINYGAAGIAYSLYRIACAREDSALLSLADIWASRAAHNRNSEHAFYNPQIEITAEMVGGISPYHTASGIFCVQALIAGSRGDVVSQQGAINAFLLASSGPCESLDITLGRSSTLLAGSLLLDALIDSPMVESKPLVEVGNRAMAEVWDKLDSYEAIEKCPQIPYLGMAHGWAGFAYAAMRWCKSTGEALPHSLEERLRQLAALAEPRGRGIRWKWIFKSGHGSAPSNAYMPGWCNGSAGYVFLWTLAHRTFGDQAYLDLAEKTAWNVWEEQDTVGQLCCGLAGRAYALLNYYKYTGESAWLHRARDLAGRAAGSVRKGMGLENMPDSLYKGEIGVAVLAADLSKPEVACMPFFEEER